MTGLHTKTMTMVGGHTETPTMEGGHTNTLTMGVGHTNTLTMEKGHNNFYVKSYNPFHNLSKIIIQTNFAIVYYKIFLFNPILSRRLSRLFTYLSKNKKLEINKIMAFPNV